MNDHQFEEIAIIGMSCRFPQAKNCEEYWENLKNGKESITFFSAEELEREGVEKELLQYPRYIKAKAVVEDALCFDAPLFDCTPKEAETMDPQQRLLLQCGWEALENAGYDPNQYEGSIGVFVGCNPSSYFLTQFGLSPIDSQTGVEELAALIGNGHDYLATRLSYSLNLKGPSKTVQTACSTSLVAVHDACQSLLNYQCDLALAGGVSITFPLKAGYFYSPDGINSPDGHCRAFDAQAAGTIFGDGLGLVALKRLEDALADQDTILAVIKGSAINNDGSEKMSFLAPSVEGQARVIASALASADVSAETISYVETHGTGTFLGDPIEIAALTKAFRLHTQKNHFCPIGSVKASIGHLISAAGIASLIKTVLMLNHRQIPASLHFEKGNPQIPFEETPFYVNSQLTPWETHSSPLRAGVSSFGMGGTNAHVILEEPPKKPSSTWINQPHLVPFSANTPEALHRLIEEMANHLKKERPALADVAFTMQRGRKALPFRTYFIANDLEELLEKMQAPPTITKVNYQPKNAEMKEEGDALEMQGKLWVQGEKIKWPKKGRRIPLPTYPFSKTVYLKEKQTQVERSSVPTGATLGERILSLIWQDALKVGNLDRSDNFFALGGDSLVALEITDQVRSLFKIELSLKDLFSYPTLQQFAACVEEKIKNPV